MKKLLKKTLLLCMMLCGILAAFSFTACTQENKDDKGDFVVYVQYEDGKGVAGVWASWCIMNDDSGVCISAEQATDANGKASIAESTVTKSYASKSFHIKLDEVPEGYTYQKDADGYYNGDDYVVTTSNRTVTITLTKAN